MFSVTQTMAAAHREIIIIYRALPERIVEVSRPDYDKSNISLKRKDSRIGVNFGNLAENLENDKEGTIQTYPRQKIKTTGVVITTIRENRQINDTLGNYLDGEIGLRTQTPLQTIDPYNTLVGDIVFARDNYWKVKQSTFDRRVGLYDARLSLINQLRTEEYGVLQDD